MSPLLLRPKAPDEANLGDAAAKGASGGAAAKQDQGAGVGNDAARREGVAQTKAVIQRPPADIQVEPRDVDDLDKLVVRKVGGPVAVGVSQRCIRVRLQFVDHQHRRRLRAAIGRPQGTGLIEQRRPATGGSPVKAAVGSNAIGHASQAIVLKFAVPAQLIDAHPGGVKEIADVSAAEIGVEIDPFGQRQPAASRDHAAGQRLQGVARR